MPNSAPTPSFYFILHKGLQKGLTHGLYHLSKRTAIEVSGRKEPKVVLRTLGNHQSQNTFPNSCPQSEHPYCNNLCLPSILKITCSFDPVKNSGREGGGMQSFCWTVAWTIKTSCPRRHIYKQKQAP